MYKRIALILVIVLVFGILSVSCTNKKDGESKEEASVSGKIGTKTELLNWSDSTMLNCPLDTEILKVSNNYEFPIREVIRIPKNQNQQKDDQIIIEVELEPGETKTYNLRDIQSEIPEFYVVESFMNGLPKVVRDKSGREVTLFDVRFIEFIDNKELVQLSKPDGVQGAMEGMLHTPMTTLFQPVQPLNTSSGFKGDKITYHGAISLHNEYEVEITYSFYNQMEVTDINVVLKRTGGNHDTGYLAAVKIFDSKSDDKAHVCWNGETMNLRWGECSPPRTVRAHTWGRDVDWLSLVNIATGEARVLLADFAPGMAKINDDGKYTVVNNFLVNEFVTSDQYGWNMVSEISGKNTMQQSYIKENNILPAIGEEVRMDFRYIIPSNKIEVDEINAAFTSYTGYRLAQVNGKQIEIDFGVKDISFGSCYFPHSTFGENFEFWRSAGLTGDIWWPVFENWEFFKEEIIRDIRIARAMGLDWIRIHKFNTPTSQGKYLETDAGKWMLDYLDFMVAQVKACGMKMLLDFKLSEEDAKLVAQKYGDTIRYFEIENEALITHGAQTSRIPYWNQLYNAIKEVDPELSVFITGGPNFQPLYNALNEHDLQFDCIGQHGYVDGGHAPANVKDFALALGGYATRNAKIPLNTEFNWRQMTRESEDRQAEHFEEIFENFISQRATPILFQFQYQETFTVPPRRRGAMRHYESLRFDRTPKPQGYKFMDIIRKYVSKDHPARVLQIDLTSGEIPASGSFLLTTSIKNNSDNTISLKTKLLLPKGFTVVDEKGVETDVAKEFTLKGGETINIVRKVNVDPNLAPGFYHYFEEIQYDDEIFFGWGYSAVRKAPRVDVARMPFDGVSYFEGTGILKNFDLSSIDYVIFGMDAHSLEVDWAYYLYNTLRSATGSPIQRFSDKDPESELAMKSNSLIIGNQRSNKMLKNIEKYLPVDPLTLKPGEGVIMIIDNPESEGDKILIVSGRDAEGMQKAASDLLLRYWCYAKDAVTFRTGMPPAVFSGIESEEMKKIDTGSMLVIEGPETAVVGKEIRFVVMDMAEPPTPAPNQKLIAVSEAGVSTTIGTSDASGVLMYTFDEAGSYNIFVADDDGKPLNNNLALSITVKTE